MSLILVCSWSRSTTTNKDDVLTLTFACWCIGHKMMSLINKLGDRPPNYHKTARTFPQIFCTPSLEDDVAALRFTCWRIKLTSLINKLADWSPNYHKRARTFPHVFCTPSFNEPVDSTRASNKKAD